MDGSLECPSSESVEYFDNNTSSAYWPYQSSAPTSGGFSSDTFVPSDCYSSCDPSWSSLQYPLESPPISEPSSYSRAPSSRTSYNDIEGEDSFVESPRTPFFDNLRTQSPNDNLRGSRMDPSNCDLMFDLRRPPLPVSGPANFPVSYASPETGPYTCTEGCLKKSFGRPYDLNRHILEQHRCPHEDCKDLKFTTPSEKKAHKRGHTEIGLGYRCGTCALTGISPKPLSRKEKLRKHLRDQHKTSDDLEFAKFQCLHAPCYLGGSCGGIYFTSRHDLEEHIQHLHTPEALQGKPLDGGMHRLISSKPFTETVGVGNASKRPHDQDLELEAKRWKTRSNDFDSPNPQQGIASSETCHLVDSKADSYTASGPLQTPVEETLNLSVIDLQTLIKQQRWASILEDLSSLHISPTFDCKKSALKLRGSCSATEMEKGRTLLADAINQAKSINLQCDEIDVSTSPNHRKGFHQQVSVHPQPEISALDPVEDTEILALWNTKLLPKFPGIVREAFIEGSYSVALVRQHGPNGAHLVIRFRSSGNQGETSRQIFQESVDSICVANSCSILSVQFTEGTLVRLARGSSTATVSDPSNDRKFPHGRRPWGKPGMGASIGPSQCPHVSATLGGYISVDGRIYMLTVDHFISECQCIVDTRLRSPSISDIRSVRHHLTKKFKDISLRISRSAPDEVPLGQAEGLLFPWDVNEELEQYKRVERELNDRENGFALGVIRYRCEGGMLPLRPSANPRLAGVLHRMDWSLSEIFPKHREGKNMHRHGRVAEPGIADIAKEVLSPEGCGTLCATTGEAAGGEGAFYVGTTSGFREGSINPALIQYGDEHGISHEWSLVVPRCETLKDSDFQGDSGAWIIGNDNSLLGLLWGWDNGNLLFTPIQDVFADIKQRMNCQQIKLPEYFSGPRTERSASLLCRRDSTPEPVEPEANEVDGPVVVIPGLLSPFDITKSRRSSSASVWSLPSLLSSASSGYDEASPCVLSPSPSSGSLVREGSKMKLSIRTKSRSLPTCALSEAAGLDWVHIDRDGVVGDKTARPLEVMGICQEECKPIAA